MPGGRPPKPTLLKIAEGDRGKRGMGKLQERRARELAAVRGLPECPEHLDGIASEAWGFFGDQLVAMQADFAVDAKTLEGVCIAYQEAVEAHKIIRTKGMTIEIKQWDKRAEEFVVISEQPRPEVAIRNQAWNRFKAFANDLGFTLAGRGKLNLGNGEDSEIAKIEAALSQPRNRTA